MLYYNNYLSDEILSMIFSKENFIVKTGKRELINDRSYYKEALAVSLVCQKWSQHGRRLLWNHVKIDNSDFISRTSPSSVLITRSLPSLHPLKYLLKFPHLARFVKKVSFYLTDGLNLNLPSEYSTKEVVEKLGENGFEFLGRFFRSLLAVQELDIRGAYPYFLLFALEQIPKTLVKVGWWDREEAGIQAPESFAYLSDLTTRIARHRRLSQLEIYSTTGFRRENNLILHSIPTASLSIAGYSSNQWTVGFLRATNGISLTRLCLDYQRDLASFLSYYPFINLTSLLFRLLPLQANEYQQFLSDVGRLLPLHPTLTSLTLTGPDFIYDSSLVEPVLDQLPYRIEVLTLTFLSQKKCEMLIKRFLSHRRFPNLKGIYVQGERSDTWVNLVENDGEKRIVNKQDSRSRLQSEFL